MSLRSRAVAGASIRGGIGVASILAPKAASKVGGFPVEHDNPSARVLAGLFGVRELLLAWLVIDAVRRPGGPSPSVFALQAAVDAADVAVQSLPLIRRQGLDRAALGGIALAGGAALGWGRMARAAARA
ncbi:MAG: hypothetical protein ABI808_13165 [Pseudonocardiales bacterium]